MIRSRFQVWGHPIHPMLIPFPIAFFIGGFIFDALYLVTGTVTWYTVATWMLVAGVVGAVLAAAAGLVDYVTAIPAQAPAKSTATAHLVANGIATALFAVTMVLHLTGDALRGTLPLVVTLVNLVGVIILGVGGWLGGELVYRHHVGVEPTHPGERELRYDHERAA
ncbi:MAG: DUF2231 domain-containing protein [Chloroflexi bacterium]|nr:DUF2231 domain-containing protein [Chloroflexota bacterium]